MTAQRIRAHMAAGIDFNLPESIGPGLLAQVLALCEGTHWARNSMRGQDHGLARLDRIITNDR